MVKSPHTYSKRGLLDLSLALVFVLLPLSNKASCETLVYQSQYTNHLIPADSSKNKGLMNDAIIDITEHGTIFDLDIGLTITHTKVFDLQINIVSPAGTTIVLNTYDAIEDYFDGENYTSTIFDDDALIAIGSASPPFQGRYKPKTGYQLSDLNGQDMFGKWRLRINDAFYANTGKLEEFKLMITVPEPSSLLLLLSGIAVVRRCTRRRKIIE